RKQAQLDADTREADAAAAPLRRRREVVIPRQLPLRHAASIVRSSQRRVCAVRFERERVRTRVQRVSDDLRQDRLLERSRVRVAQILQEVDQVYPRFTQSVLLRSHWWSECFRS